MNLILGTLDVAYGDSRGKSGAATTAEVARILEDRYHVMATFYDAHQDEIGEALSQSVADAVEAVVKRGSNSAAVHPTLAGESKIEASFRNFLDAEEMAKMVAGLSESERSYFLSSTGGFAQAAQRGVNHRKKHPFTKKNRARPAFIDTGLYRASFRAWTEQ